MMACRGIRKIALVCSLPAILASCSAKFPEEIRAFLEEGERFELLSLSPARGAKGGDNFHDWHVLGRMTVTDSDTRRKIVAAFKNGIEGSDGAVAACFNPRHGIRAIRNGRTADFVICFECLQTRMYVDDKQKELVTTTRSPEPVFDGALKAAGLPLARGVGR